MVVRRSILVSLVLGACAGSPHGPPEPVADDPTMGAWPKEDCYFVSEADVGTYAFDLVGMQYTGVAKGHDGMPQAKIRIRTLDQKSHARVGAPLDVLPSPRITYQVKDGGNHTDFDVILTIVRRDGQESDPHRVSNLCPGTPPK